MAGVSLPLTYPDLVCELDLDPFGNETTSDLQSLMQDVFHLLKELPGSNPDDPDRGLGVDQYLSGTADQWPSFCRLAEAQLGQDDRIDTVSCNVTLQADGTYRIRLDISVNGSVIPLEYGWQDGNFSNFGGPF